MYPAVLFLSFFDENSSVFLSSSLFSSKSSENFSESASTRSFARRFTYVCLTRPIHTISGRQTS